MEETQIPATDGQLSNYIPASDVKASAYVVGASNGHVNIKGVDHSLDIIEHYANGDAKVKINLTVRDLLNAESVDLSSLGLLSGTVNVDLLEGDINLTVDHIPYDESGSEGHWFLTQQ